MTFVTPVTSTQDFLQKKNMKYEIMEIIVSKIIATLECSTTHDYVQFK